MTTFDEITTDPAAHFEYFSDRARLNAILYFEHRRSFGRDHGFTRLEKSGFRANMRERREKTYLEPDEAGSVA